MSSRQTAELRAIGIAGLGSIGSAIAERLLSSEHEVIGFDPDPAARGRLESLGGRGVATPAELGGSTSAVLLAVPDTAEIEEALFGEDGLAERLAPGSWVAVLSTVDPSTPQRIAERLAPSGVAVIDAALSGGPDRARTGELSLMVGGTEAAFELAAPVLGVIADPVVHVGPVGHGEIAKLANNLAGIVIVEGLAEALSLAAKSGADVERVAEAIAAASGSSWVLREWLPSTTFAGDYSPRFRLALMNKDIGLIRELAGKLGVEVPALDLCASRFESAAEAGLADLDFSAIIEHHARSSGASIRPEVELPTDRP